MAKAAAESKRARRARHPSSKSSTPVKRKTRLSEVEQMRLAPPGSLYTNPFASVFTCKVDGKCKPADALSFVKRNKPRGKGGGFSYWVVKPIGDYARDCATGHGYAQELLPHLKYHGGISLLGCIVLDMIRSGKHEEDRGLVVGFMSELSCKLNSVCTQLALYAAASLQPNGLPARSKSLHAKLKKKAVKAAIPTLQSVGSIIS